MSSSSETFCMRLLAAAHVAEAEARIWTFKRTALARLEAFNAQLEAEYVKLENAAVVAKARHKAMEKFVQDELMEKLLERKMDKILEYSQLNGNVSQDSGNCSTGKLCGIIEENSEISGPAGHSRNRMKNPTRTHGALWETGLGQVVESRVLQTHAEKVERKTEGQETEDENQSRKIVERDIEHFENVLTIDEMKIEVEMRRMEMKMEIQRRKKEAENRRMEMKEEISQRKKDVENTRGKWNGENSGRNREEENSEGEYEGSSRNEIDEKMQEIETEIIDENPDKRKIEERREEKLPEANQESIAEEEDSKIETQEVSKEAQENKEVAECNQDTGKPLRENSREKRTERQATDNQYVYRQRYRAKRKRPPLKADQIPRSTVKRQLYFNRHCLRPPETCKRSQNFIPEFYRERLIVRPG